VLFFGDGKWQPFCLVQRIYIRDGYLSESLLKKFISRNEEIILLAILKLGDDAYGVSIRDRIYQDMGDKWSFASIYQPLDNLLKRKYVLRKKGTPTAKRGGKSKYYYEVTPAGKEVLIELKRANEQVWSGIPFSLWEKGK
jgi:DNA-binding PadR family transcriptional regulator